MNGLNEYFLFLNFLIGLAIALLVANTIVLTVFVISAKRRLVRPLIILSGFMFLGAFVLFFIEERGMKIPFLLFFVSGLLNLSVPLIRKSK
ncbi:MAG: hypothetical protein IT236_09855 [Bacteroidia bacterium]|nr:hypothetical protein [Bacteroidia bacterium]